MILEAKVVTSLQEVRSKKYLEGSVKRVSEVLECSC